MTTRPGGIRASTSGALRSRIARLAVIVVVAPLIAWATVSPRPAPLPVGATALTLRTQPPPGFPWLTLGCPAVLILPIRVERDDGSMVFWNVERGSVVDVAWPYGYTARVVDGRAELVTPSGTVLARDGAVISGLEGSAGINGDVLVCIPFIDARFEVNPRP